MTQAVAERVERVAPAAEANAPITPMQMLQYAVERGSDIAVVEKMMLLAERWEANQARRAFDEAMAGAKAEMPVISKNRTVDFTSQKGRTHYRHEDLGEIARVVSPILGRHGLSYRFRVNTESKTATVTCIITHRDGHTDDTNTLSCAHDDSGNKNAIQQLGSAITYLQRMTLKAALGLAASNDDDGQASAKAQTSDVLNAAHLKQLRDALTFRDIPEDRACKRFKVKSLEDIYQVDFDACLRIAQTAGGAK